MSDTFHIHADSRYAVSYFVFFALLSLSVSGGTFEIEQRVAARLGCDVNAVAFVHAPEFAPEQYEIRAGTSNAVEIVGSTRRARLYGLGRYVRKPAFRGRSAPKMLLRGIYFATHFGNWYDTASEEEIGRYIEDLALWGCNQVRVWFDMHDYTGVDDPKAQSKIRRLKTILKFVKDCGLETSLICLSNEAFAGSPKELRADWHGGQNGYVHNLVGHYHVEICPSNSKGLDLLLKERAAVLDLFADVGLSEVAFFSYDQGGCTCAGCAPWGCNGMLKILPRFSKLVREKIPGCRIEFSTWYFDHFGPALGEWRGLKDRIAEVAKYADGLAVENLDVISDGVPGGLPASSMPEISMHGMLPWGGFGANPQPKSLTLLFRRGCGKLAGFRPYSEGIYEDLNKVLFLGLGWEPMRTPEEIVGDYAAFYFGEASRPAVVEAIGLLEDSLGHMVYLVQDRRRFNAYNSSKVDAKRPYSLTIEGKSLDSTRTLKARRLLESVDATLSPESRSSWRWRILFLRARIDDLLAHGTTLDDGELAKCFAELARLYKVNNTTEPFVTPPGPQLRPDRFHAGLL